MYKIVSRDLEIEETYVGSSTAFVNRKSYHKTHANMKERVPKGEHGHRECDSKLYTFIANNGGWSNFDLRILYIGSFSKKSVFWTFVKTSFWGLF